MPLQMLIVSDSELTGPPWTRCCPAERHCRGRGSCQSAAAAGCCDLAQTQSPWSRHRETIISDSDTIAIYQNVPHRVQILAVLNVMHCCSLETSPGTLYSTYDLNTDMIPFLLN